MESGKIELSSLIFFGRHRSKKKIIREIHGTVE